MIKSQTLTISHQISAEALEIQLAGRLCRQESQDLLQKFQALMKVEKISTIRIHAGAITDCDTIGLISLNEALKYCQIKAIHYELSGLHEKFSKLWQCVTEESNIESVLPQEPHLTQVELVGKSICDQISHIKENIAFIGEVVHSLFKLIRRPSRIRIRNLWYYIEDIGPNSFPLILLIGVLFGLILSFQSLVQLKKFGAEIYVANLVSVSLIRELGPLLMAIILTGRIASAYAAEISAMKVNQEIDALESMGIDPIPFLVIPRLIAVIIVAPFVTLILDLFGLLGCGGLMISEGFSSDVIIQNMFSFVGFNDLFTSMLKSMVFGFMIVAIGCIHGLNCGRDTTAVGQATTATVVKCIIMITVVDGIFTSIFYIMGLS